MLWRRADRGTYSLLGEDFGRPSAYSELWLSVWASGYADKSQRLWRALCNAWEAYLFISYCKCHIRIGVINDVLYRYGIGWSAPYSESDIQAQDIAMNITRAKAERYRSGESHCPNSLWFLVWWRLCKKHLNAGLWGDIELSQRRWLAKNQFNLWVKLLSINPNNN